MPSRLPLTQREGSTMRTFLRPVAVVAAGLITATLLQAPAGATPVDDGGTWLKKQLTGNLAVTEYWDDWSDPQNPTWVEYTDGGLTADVAITLAAIGGSRRKVSAIGEALAPEVSNWTAATAATPTPSPRQPSPRRPPVRTRGHFGGIDLVARARGPDRRRGRADHRPHRGRRRSALTTPAPSDRRTQPSPSSGQALRRPTSRWRSSCEQQCSAGLLPPRPDSLTRPPRTSPATPT